MVKYITLVKQADSTSSPQNQLSCKNSINLPNYCPPPISILTISVIVFGFTKPNFLLNSTTWMNEDLPTHIIKNNLHMSLHPELTFLWFSPVAQAKNP
jgi:hypothetical protein